MRSVLRSWNTMIGIKSKPGLWVNVVKCPAQVLTWLQSLPLTSTSESLCNSYDAIETAISITISLRIGKPDIIISFPSPNTLKFQDYSLTFTKTKKPWHHIVVQMVWPHGDGICKSTCPWLHVFISVPLIEIRWHFLKVHQGKLLRSYFPESWNILLTPKPPLCSVCQSGNLKYLIAFFFFFQKSWPMRKHPFGMKYYVKTYIKTP